LVRPTEPERTLLVGTSSSGATERVVHAIERARQHGAVTVALTNTPGSPVTTVAERSIILSLPNNERSAGIRTYQASLSGMLLIAIWLAQLRGLVAQSQAQALRAELAGASSGVAATASSVAASCAALADAIAGTPALMVIGSGPSYGTALFAAAKVVEGAGVFAAGQDLEEWYHVERFAHPLDMPVFVIAPPGRSRWRALEVAERATSLGRRVVAVASAQDTQIAALAWRTLPVQGRAREEFSPLLYHIFASLMAAPLARQLGRKPFQSDLQTKVR
jgi:glutamine---fructose-6-phosphate transaminase (isomerizing)